MRNALFAILSIIASAINLIYSLLLQTALQKNYDANDDLGDFGYLMLSLIPRVYNIGLAIAALVLVLVASIRKEPRQRVRQAWIMLGIAILAFSIDVVMAMYVLWAEE